MWPRRIGIALRGRWFWSRPERAAGSEAPAGEHLSQEELLRQPVQIPHRPLKDPRDIRLLDPACGSMHFGLYAFDLFEVIYEEAWADEQSPASEVTGKTLREDYPTLERLRAEIPGLILRHNLHGIDIDPRAVQIPGTGQQSDERLMVVPLKSGEQVQGAMAVWRSGGQPFEAHELAFLEVEGDVPQDEGLDVARRVILGDAAQFDHPDPLTDFSS